MKKPLKITLVVIALVGLALAAFQWGRSVGASSARYTFGRVENRLTHLNALAAYSANVKISEHLSSERSDQASCLANLYASAYARQVRGCLADPQCRSLIYDEAKAEAPELLGSANDRYRYYEENESCHTGNEKY